MTAEENPLAAVEAAESAMFRMGQLARRLLAEHPTLPLVVLRPEITSRRAAFLALSVETLAEVRTWAAALGGETSAEKAARVYGSFGYWYLDTVANIEGIAVRVACAQPMTEAELAAWHADQGDAPGGGSS